MSEFTSTMPLGVNKASYGVARAAEGTGAIGGGSFRPAVGGTALPGQQRQSSTADARQTQWKPKSPQRTKAVDVELIDRSLDEISRDIPDEYERKIQLQNFTGFRSQFVEDLADFGANTQQVIVLLDSLFAQILKDQAMSPEQQSAAIEAVELLRLPVVSEAAIDSIIGRFNVLGLSILP